MKSFINRPIPRLLRYELLLKGIMDETPAGHEDLESIPNVIEVIKALGKETEPGVQESKQKVEVWRYNANIQFKAGESIVSFFLLDKASFPDLSACRTWIFLIVAARLYILVNSFANPKAVWNGTDGVNFMFFSLITTVRRLSYRSQCNTKNS